MSPDSRTGAPAAPADRELPADRAVPGSATATREHPRGRARRPRMRRVLIPTLFVAPVLVYAALFFAYPLVYGVMMSFEQLGFSAMVQGSGRFTGFTNYTTVLSNPVTMLALRNTVVFTVVSVACQVGIGLAVAMLLSKKFMLAGILRRLVLVPWLVPLLATGTVFSLLFGTQNGPVNIILQHLHLVHNPVPWLIEGKPAIIAIILVNIWAGLPFNIVVLYSGLQDIDPVLYDAAMVDGASPGQKFRHITLPLLRPVLLIVIMLGIIGTVKVFDIVWVMTQGGPNNATQLLSTWSYTEAFTNFDFGKGAAIANLLLVISFILALIYLRSLRARDSR